jgi:hypothetical protein
LGQAQSCGGAKQWQTQQCCYACIVPYGI